MERRRTDRRQQLEMVLASLFVPPQRLITDKRNTQNWNEDSTSGPLTCANPVGQIPLFVTRNVISGHEVFLGLLYAAVNRTQRGVLRYLEGAESKETDVWRQQDYRTAQVILVLADEGKGNPYSKAFRQLFGKNAHEVRFWWRDREKLAAVSRIANSPLPLCFPKIGQSLPDELIPDYDPSLQVSPARSVSRLSPGWREGQQAQGNSVSSGGAHAERP